MALFHGQKYNLPLLGVERIKHRHTPAHELAVTSQVLCVQVQITLQTATMTEAVAAEGNMYNTTCNDGLQQHASLT